MRDTVDDPGADLPDRLKRLERRLARQVRARQEAETLLERKSFELYELNRHLADLNASLEQRVRDRTRELEQERQNAVRLAESDPLTGLPNRLKFGLHVQQALDTAAPDEQIAVLNLDLDGFKAVNDALGHILGDELIRAVAARLQLHADSNTLICRLGGDEFAAVQTGRCQPEAAEALAERIAAALRYPFSVGGQSIRVGATIGLVTAQAATASLDRLLYCAGTALHRAKRNRRGRWKLFRPEMEQEILARQELERDLRQALARDQLQVYYQSLVEARTGALLGFEALLRWKHPVKGMVPPSVFIPLAEEVGLIHTLGAWTIRQACADAATWPAGVKIAVNLSPAQFTGGTLLADIVDALARSGLAPNRLELEITESVLLQENQATLEILQRLRRIGTRLSMGDFGTGYSSLSYINRFPFDKIKIDRSFIDRSARENGGAEIIRAIIGLGKALHITVLAEGVETQEEWQFLRQAGCDELQGYLFSKPQPAEKLEGLLAGRRIAQLPSMPASNQWRVPLPG